MKKNWTIHTKHETERESDEKDTLETKAHQMCTEWAINKFTKKKQTTQKKNQRKKINKENIQVDNHHTLDSTQATPSDRECVCLLEGGREKDKKRTHESNFVFRFGLFVFFTR